MKKLVLVQHYQYQPHYQPVEGRTLMWPKKGDIIFRKT